MQNIMIYDTEDEKIEKICADNNITPAELIEALFTALEDNGIDFEDYI